MTQMNLSMKQKPAHRHREQTCGCQEEAGWEREGLSPSVLPHTHPQASNLRLTSKSSCSPETAFPDLFLPLGA